MNHREFSNFPKIMTHRLSFHASLWCLLVVANIASSYAAPLSCGAPQDLEVTTNTPVEVVVKAYYGTDKG